MYRTKQHVDKHVLSILHRLRDEKDVSSIDGRKVGHFLITIQKSFKLIIN